MKTAVLVLFVCAGASAQLSEADKSVEAACAAAATTPLPLDMAGVKTPAKYPKCDSYRLYDKKQFAAARACAVRERAALLARVPGSPSSLAPVGSPDDELAPAGGLVVLSELYGNGQGVRQSAALAARFYCEGIDTQEVSHDASETKEILAMLNRLRSLKRDSAPVAYCNQIDAMDTPQDTPWTRRCNQIAELAHAEMHQSGIQSGFDDAQKDADDARAKLKPVAARFSTAQRVAYKRAAAAMQHFIDAQATGDILYMGGYGSGGLYPNELQAAFDQSVVAVVKHPPVAASEADFATADATLNAVYRKLIEQVGARSEFVGRELTPENLRAEERAWIVYRDAFASLGRVLKPDLSANTWMLLLTRERTKDLQAIVDLVGDKHGVP